MQRTQAHATPRNLPRPKFVSFATCAPPLSALDAHATRKRTPRHPALLSYRRCGEHMDNFVKFPDEFGLS